MDQTNHIPAASGPRHPGSAFTDQETSATASPGGANAGPARTDSIPTDSIPTDSAVDNVISADSAVTHLNTVNSNPAGSTVANANSIDPTPALKVQDLNIYYGSFHAVRNVSFHVQPGEIFGLLGPNGAGKTSTLSASEGLIKPHSGDVWVSGYSIREKTLYARANMGVQLQSTSFQPELTITEIIQLYAGIYGLKLSKDRVAALLQEINLQEASGKRFGQLSGGQQQRVSLAIATIHNPRLVLLDEPTTGLDPQARRQLWERIEGMRDKGHGILLTTHSMEEAEAVCDRVAIIDHGQIIAIDTPQALIDTNRDNPEVIRASRKGKITLEDVFIGLTGTAVRS